MTIIFTSLQIHQIYAHSENIYPEECCGILLGRIAPADRTVTEVILTANTWLPADQINDSPVSAKINRSKYSRYTIAPQDIFQAQKRARKLDIEIIGFFHSHPDHPAIPSACDRHQAWEVYSYPIISVVQGQVSQINSWVLDINRIFQPEEIQILGATSDRLSPVI